MANLKEVKGRIKSVISTQQITKAMKMVAASKLRRAQEKIQQMRPYSQRLTRIIENVTAGAGDELNSPYAETREVKRVLLVVETSDRGLCGAFNSSVFKFTKNLIASHYKNQELRGDLYLLPIGKKALDHFKKRDYKVIQDHSHLFEKLRFEEVKETAEYVMKLFLDKEFDRVEIIYNEFKNVATQVIQSEQFLPISSAEESQEEGSIDYDYIFEPDKEKIFEELLPRSLKIQFYKTLLDSNASEHGARMTAMDQATDNAEELLKDLKQTYNQTRQAAITTELSEIVAGAEALSQG